MDWAPELRNERASSFLEDVPPVARSHPFREGAPPPN